MASASLFSFEEFERLPETLGKQELLHGELIELPPATIRHRSIAKKFQKQLETGLHESRVGLRPDTRLRTDGWCRTSAPLGLTSGS